jgi:Zn finger protein HypA/HybF involved in hydrogenase expression
MEIILFALIFVGVCAAGLASLNVKPKESDPPGKVKCPKCTTESALKDIACPNCGNKKLKINRDDPVKPVVQCPECKIDAAKLPCPKCGTDLIKLLIEKTPPKPA